MKGLKTILALACLFAASPAAGQVLPPDTVWPPEVFTTLDCGDDIDGDGTGDDCTHRKYGTSPPEDRGFRLQTDTEDFDPNGDRGPATSVWNRDTLAGSFRISRPMDPLIPGGNPRWYDCGGEVAYAPIVGQFILREFDDCVPDATEPGATPNGTCSAGSGNPGEACESLVDCCCDANGCDAEGELTCMQTQSCNYTFSAAPGCELDGSCGRAADGGCPVEIPLDLQDNYADPNAGVTGGGNQPVSNIPGFWNLNASTRIEWGGASGPNRLTRSSGIVEQCHPDNNVAPTLGFRYNVDQARKVELNALHPDFELGPDATYIRWVDSPVRGMRVYSDGFTCCSSILPGACLSIPFILLQEYPAFASDSCTEFNNTYRARETADYLFKGGADSDWTVDPEWAPPGQTEGVCETNRHVSCDICEDNPTAPGCDNLIVPNHHQRGNPCADPANYAFPAGSPLGDLDPNFRLCQAPDVCAPGSTTNLGPLAPGSGPRIIDGCDMREWQRNAAPDTTGSPEFDRFLTRCAVSQHRLRGFHNRYCGIIGYYDRPGDPGDTCNVFNFGANPRPDDDCDGVADTHPSGNPEAPADLCPLNNEFDYWANADATDVDGIVEVGPLRGDECECGDQAQDGRIDINDILGQNRAIFGLEDTRSIGDASNDLVIDINDILATNGDIFSIRGTACRHVTLLSCGSNSPTLDAGEECDDGGNPPLPDDGCDTACLVEDGWACTPPMGVCGDTVNACSTNAECAGEPDPNDQVCVIDTPSVCGLIPG